MRKILSIAVCVSGITSMSNGGENFAPSMVTSSAGHYWQTVDSIRWQESATGKVIQLEIDPTKTEQGIKGFSGCFNEKGWEVLNLLDAEKRNEILRELFDPQQGCCFALGRMPMGANDYSLEWYSFDETRDDYVLEHFSIARDREYLIPYIKCAQQFNSALKVWASP